MLKDVDLICKLNRDWRPNNIKVKKAGGQTNRNYIVQHKNKKFFIRLPWERADIINRKIEAKNAFALSRNKKLAKILPPYYIFIFRGKNILLPKSREIFDLPNGAMMTEYIEGRSFTISLFRKKKYQEQLARLFNIFHKGGVKFQNEYNVFRDEIEKYRIAAKKYPIFRIVGKEDILRLENIEKKAKENTLSFGRGVATHNDFIFQNFLVGKNNKIYLLDFEYAGLNKKGGILYDFGFLFADNLFRRPPVTKELFEEFLLVADKIYGQKLDRRQIYWLAIAATLVMFWWGAVRYFSVKTKKEKSYFKNYILKRARGIEFLYNLVE